MSDDDDLAWLKAALTATPAPDPAAKAAALRRAEENFEALQESARPASPTKTASPKGGVLKGLKTMFAQNSMKPLLLTTSSLVVVGIGVVLMQPGVLPDFQDTSAFREDDESVIVDPITVEPVIEEPVIAEAVTSNQSFADIAERAPQAQAPAPQFSRRAKTNDGGVAALSGDVSPLPAPDAPQGLPASSNDRFANAAPNPLKITAQDPVSTFSTDVDTASFAWVRQSLQNGALPVPQSVRVEEMINYFPYDYAAPDGPDPFATTVSVAGTPWNAGTKLVHIGLQGALPEVEDRPPLNLVFLIDTSGSMNSPDKLPLLVQSFRLMLAELRPEDQVAIVTYAGSSGLVLEPTKASDRATINAALANLSAGGSTAGAAGLQQAGNGQAAYIDTLSEARKVLVDQLTGALFPIAGDVKVQVEWNPAQIAEYRLIGYETRSLRREEFNNDKVDAGDIGAGLQVTALYEVTPVGSPAILNDALRYDAPTDTTPQSDELGFLRLRYKQPGESTSQLIETPITEANPTSTEAGFATAIAGFGQLLRGSDYLGNWSYADAVALATQTKGADPYGYRAEAITLMRLAESLAKAQ
jgi:secreted protein with Ig-like and vWFA domain